MAGKIACAMRTMNGGAIAIDTNGHVFIAEGGNEYDGAKCWVAMTGDITEGDNGDKS